MTAVQVQSPSPSPSASPFKRQMRSSKKQKAAAPQAQAQPPKRSSFFNFLALKEPSQQALLEYEAHLRAVSKNGRNTELASVPKTKLPAEVPKVNSKWDGLPENWKERKEASEYPSPRSRSGSLSTNSRGRQDSVSSPRSPAMSTPYLGGAPYDGSNRPPLESHNSFSNNSLSNQSFSTQSQSSLGASRDRSVSMTSQVTGRSTAPSYSHSLSPTRSDVYGDNIGLATPLTPPTEPFEGLKIDMGSVNRDGDRLAAVDESDGESRTPVKPSAGYSLFPGVPKTRQDSRPNAGPQPNFSVPLPTHYKAPSVVSPTSRPSTARPRTPKAQAEAEATADSFPLPPTGLPISPISPRAKMDASIAPWDFMDDETIEKIVHKSPASDKKLNRKRSKKRL